MPLEELQAAAQGAARAYKARFVDPGAEWRDIVQEATVAILANRRVVEQAENPGAMAYVVAFRAIKAYRARWQASKVAGVAKRVFELTPEEHTMYRQMLTVVGEIVTETKLARKAVGVAALTGETVASVAKRERVTSGFVYNKVWLLRQALAKDQRIQEWEWKA